MSTLKLRILALTLLLGGGYLFLTAVQDISSGVTRTVVGLLSVLFIGMGFGLLIMPVESSPSDRKTDPREPG